ncbi:MAG TPA: glycerophosphodiester phosphodiesterase family protein [Actinomycetota bacterium]|jgi:glycerophosphoryl diester phosphodiesterase|nr:glycerophosphodiester phosphodiesterase family protein [Actinomycetota bacterium]
MTTARSLPARPLVVAHRGASADLPENTLVAFEAAARAGADIIEFDLRLTADRVPVVLHDEDLSRTTDGNGLVRETTLAEVKRLDASSGRGARQEVPTLAEALELIGQTDAGVDLEIKSLGGADPGRHELLEAALKVLDAERFPGPILVSSFNGLTLQRCRELAPGLPTGFLTAVAIEPMSALAYARQAGHEFLLPQVESVLEAGPGFVEQCHGAGLRVGTWTVDDEATLEKLLRWGVDAVASNHPGLAVSVRDRVAAR